MEYLDISLLKLLRHRKESPNQAIKCSNQIILSVEIVQKLLEQIGSALKFMYRNCVVHHDVKSSNIMIHPLNLCGNIETQLRSPETVFKLIDHGMDKFYPCLTRNTVENGFFAGTPGYRCPEIVNRQVGGFFLGKITR